MRHVIKVLVAVVLFCPAVQAGTINIPLVTVGDAGNLPDPATGYGAVGYTYQIGEYDVTTAQYTFLNAVATTSDPYGLYNTGMALRPLGAFWNLGIAQSGSSWATTATRSWAPTARRATARSSLCPGQMRRDSSIGWPTVSLPDRKGRVQPRRERIRRAARQPTPLMLVTRNPGSSWVLPN